MSQPWLKFYPRDWRGDQALRAVSIAARGLWMECLCIMHTGTPYGHLTLNGRAIDIPTLARMAGIDSAEAQSLMDELKRAGVCKVTRVGVMFSKRMVSDSARAEKGRKAVETRYSQDTETVEENDGPNRSPTTQKPEARKQRAEVRKKKEGRPASAGDATASSGASPSQALVVCGPTDLELAVEAYNQAAALCPHKPNQNQNSGWAACLNLTATREKAVRARLKEVGLTGWCAAMERAAESDFLSGRAKRQPGREKWGVDIGWLAKAESFTKLIEGKYDNDRGQSQARGQDSARAGLMDFLRTPEPEEEGL